MYRSFFAPALVAVLMTTTAPVNAAQLMVKDIAVTVDLGAVSNTDAAKYWANLGDELKAAIAARIANRVAPDGVHILVKISSAALSSEYLNADGTPDPHLVGVVNVVGSSTVSGDVPAAQPAAGTKYNYELTISYKEAEAFVPAGDGAATIAPDYKAYHDAMIAAFADHVANHL
jgi:hypothetical protein